MTLSHRRTSPVALLLAAAFSAAPAAHASVITSASATTWGTSTNSSASVSTPNPGNNNVPGLSTNTLTYNLSFFAISPSGGGSAFSLAAGPGTEYTTTLNITNNTTQAWSRYDLYVGAGNIAQPTSPIPSVFAFDYDLSPTITGSGVGSAVLTLVNTSFFHFTNLNVGVGQSFTVVFNLDLPNPGSSGGWAIQQRPYPVPAPGPVLLASLGALGILARKRRVGRSVDTYTKVLATA